MSLNPPISDWTRQRVWIIGASTGIGAETAKLLLQKGAHVALSARNATALNEVAGENANALLVPLDITQPDMLVNARTAIVAAWGGYDQVLIVAGSYTEMRAQDFDLAKAKALLEINLHGVLNTLAVVLPDLQKQKSGGIGIVASVAGYSGLPKALIYGASKAALINLTESLYLDLHPQGIAVSLICPGFVATPLTAHNDFKMPALISAEEAARDLVHGLERGDFEIHFPKRFTRVLKFLRLLPYSFYFKAIHRATGL